MTRRAQSRNHPRPATWLHEVPKCTTTTRRSLSPSLSFRFLFLLEQDEPLILRRKRKYESEGLAGLFLSGPGQQGADIDITQMAVYAAVCLHVQACGARFEPCFSCTRWPYPCNLSPFFSPLVFFSRSTVTRTCLLCRAQAPAV